MKIVRKKTFLRLYQEKDGSGSVILKSWDLIHIRGNINQIIRPASILWYSC